MGVTAGVPPRVEAGVKAGLLDLVDRALEQGWTTARACAVLELDGRRCRRWQHRRSAGRLDDNTAGGTALHAITPKSAGRSWSCSSPGATSTAATASSPPRLIREAGVGLSVDAVSRSRW